MNFNSAPPQFKALRQTLIAGLISVTAISMGCGRGGPKRVPVSGKVTFAGGDWPKPGLLYFNPDQPAAGFPRGNGIGKFDSDGVYVVRSPSGDADGLYPGSYTIRVECWDVAPTMQGPPAKSFVPATFSKKIVVEPGVPLIHDFDVPKP